MTVFCAVLCGEIFALPLEAQRPEFDHPAAFHLGKSLFLENGLPNISEHNSPKKTQTLEQIKLNCSHTKRTSSWRLGQLRKPGRRQWLSGVPPRCGLPHSAGTASPCSTSSQLGSSLANRPAGNEPLPQSVRSVAR